MYSNYGINNYYFGISEHSLCNTNSFRLHLNMDIETSQLT